jgi:hypothetical protein
MAATGGDVSGALQTIMFALGIDTSKFQQGTENAQNQVKSFTQIAQDQFSNLKNSLMGLGASLASGFGIFELMKGATDYGSNVYDLSVKMNMSGDQAEYFARMLDLAGVSSTSFVSSMMRLDRSYQSTSKSGNLAINTLNAMQVSLKQGVNGPLLDWNAQLANLAAGFQKASAAGYGEEFLTNVFGSRGQEMAPLLQDYSYYSQASKMVQGVGINPQQSMQAKVNIEALQLEIKQLGYTAAVALMPLANAILPPLIKILGDLAGALKTLAPVIGIVVIALGTLSVAMLAVQWLTWLKTAITGLNIAGFVAGVMTKLGDAIEFVSVAIATDPIGFLIEALTLLLVAILAVTGAWNWLQKIMQQTVGSTMPSMSQGTSTLSKQMQDALNNVQKLGASFDELYQIGNTDDLSDLTDGLGDLGNQASNEQFGPPDQSAWSKFWDGLKNDFNNAIGWIKNVWNSTIEWMKSLPGHVWDGIKNGFNDAIGWIKGVWGSAINWMKSLPSNIWSGIKSGAADVGAFFSNVWHGMGNVARTVGGGIKTAADWVWNGMKIGARDVGTVAVAAWNGIKTGWSDATNAMKNAWDVSTSWIKTKLDDVKQGCINAWNSIKTEWDNLGTDLKNAWNNTVEWIKNETNQIWQAAKDAWDNIINGVHNVCEDIEAAFQNTVNAVVGFFQQAWQKVQSIWSNITSLGGNLNLNIFGSLPHFAAGGHVDQPTLALVGEGGQGEWIVPDTKMAAIMQDGGGTGSGGIDYARLGQEVANALAGLNLVAKIDTSRGHLQNLNRAMQPVNQAEALRRGLSPAY